jgi:acyl-CoA synthetase (AMP-forming)/AMP-acid ligase II
MSCEALRSHARKHLSSFKVPTVMRLFRENDLPMLPTGKVDRQELVRMLSAE